MSYSGKMKKSAFSVILLLLLAVTGCAAVPPKPFARSNAIPPGKMAILPFQNLSDNGEAGKVMDGLLPMTFIQHTPMKIASQDEVREGVEKLKIGSFPSRQKMKQLKQLLGVDYLVVGTVFTFTPGDAPVVSLAVRVLDAETADAVWALNLERKGKDAGKLFGAGTVRSVHMLAQMVIEEIAQTFSKSVARGSAREPGPAAVMAPAAAGTEATPQAVVTTGETAGTAVVPPPAVPEGEPPLSAQENEAAESVPAAQSQPEPASVPAIPGEVPPEAAREDAVRQQLPSVAPAPADDDRKTATGAEGVSRPVAETAKPAAGAAAALPDAAPQPVPAKVETGPAILAEKPSDLPAPATGEKGEPPPPMDTAPRATLVTGIKVVADGFEITTDGAVAGYKTFALTKPPRLVIDIIGAKSGVTRKIPLQGHGVRGVRIGAYPGKVRLVLDWRRKIPPYRIEKSDRGLKIIINDLPSDARGSRGEPVLNNAAAAGPPPVKAGRSRKVEAAADQGTCPERPVQGTTGSGGSLLELTINFEVNESVIDSGYYSQAGKVAAFIKENPGASLSIEGHADYLGSPRYNLALSQRRADSVRELLEKTFSAASARITTRGAGCNQPVADNKIPEGRDKNRRAIVRVFGPDQKTAQGMPVRAAIGE